MVQGIILGFILTCICFAIAVFTFFTKQKYETVIQDMGKKYEVEKIIYQDRVNELQKQNEELVRQQDIENKYKNSRGFYTHKKVQ